MLYKKNTSNNWFLSNGIVAAMISVIAVGANYYFKRSMYYNSYVFTPFHPALSKFEQQVFGGALIGLSVWLMMFLRGKILGSYK